MILSDVLSITMKAFSFFGNFGTLPRHGRAVQSPHRVGLPGISICKVPMHAPIIALTWDCVDFKKGVLTINKQLHRERIKGGAYRFVSLKNDKSRTIAPAKAVLNALTKQSQQQKEWR